MKLNGWWRLWIACSLVWAILGALTIGAFAYHMSTVRADFAPTLRNMCESSAMDPRAQARAGRTNNPASIEAEVKACLDRDAANHSAEWRVIAKTWAATTLVPPVVALLLGLLGAWVARGFRQSRERLS